MDTRRSGQRLRDAVDEHGPGRQQRATAGLHPDAGLTTPNTAEAETDRCLVEAAEGVDEAELAGASRR